MENIMFHYSFFFISLFFKSKPALREIYHMNHPTEFYCQTTCFTYRHSEMAKKEKNSFVKCYYISMSEFIM